MFYNFQPNFFKLPRMMDLIKGYYWKFFQNFSTVFLNFKTEYLDDISDQKLQENILCSWPKSLLVYFFRIVSKVKNPLKMRKTAVIFSQIFLSLKICSIGLDYVWLWPFLPEFIIFLIFGYFFFRKHCWTVTKFKALIQKN